MRYPQRVDKTMQPLPPSCYGVGLGTGVGRVLGIGVGLAVAVVVAVGVGVTVGVTVAVAVGLTVGVGGGGVGVHGGPWQKVRLTVSTRQPSFEPLLSLAIRQRSLPSGKPVGRFTTLVMNPSELQLQA
jgi:hypothetical protein